MLQKLGRTEHLRHGLGRHLRRDDADCYGDCRLAGQPGICGTGPVSVCIANHGNILYVDLFHVS